MNSNKAVFAHELPNHTDIRQLRPCPTITRETRDSLFQSILVAVLVKTAHRHLNPLDYDQMILEDGNVHIVALDQASRHKDGMAFQCKLRLEYCSSDFVPELVVISGATEDECRDRVDEHFGRQGGW